MLISFTAGRSDFVELGGELSRSKVNVKYGPRDNEICEVLLNLDETSETLIERVNEIRELRSRLTEAALARVSLR